MAVIRKKMWTGYYELISSGKKRYDLRLNDFEAHEGDTLVLDEWDPKTQKYTGRKIKKKVTYVGKIKIDQTFWPEADIRKKGLQILSIE